MKNKKISYTIAARDLAAHMFQVSVTVESPAPTRPTPAWATTR